VVDVFNLLAQAPRDRLSKSGSRKNGRQTSETCLQGQSLSRRKKRGTVNALATEFVMLFAELMNALLGIRDDYYDNETAMHGSITARAAFENQRSTRCIVAIVSAIL
jgi:hypothetical protein